MSYLPDQAEPRYRSLSHSAIELANDAIVVVCTTRRRADNHLNIILATKSRSRCASETRRAAGPAAKTARTAWYEEQRHEQLAALVELIESDVYERVRKIRTLVEAAGAEGLDIAVIDLPSVPLRCGIPQQASLEFTIEQLRTLVT